MRVGTVEFAIAADTRTFDTSLRQSEETAKVYAQRTEKQFQKIQVKLEDMAKITGMPMSKFKEMEDQARNMFAAMAASKDVDMLQKKLGLSAESASGLAKAMGLTAKGSDSLSSSLGSGGLLGILGGSGGGGLSGALPIVGAAIGALVTSEIINKIRDFRQEIINTKLQFDSLERTLRVVSGSQDGAAAQMEWLSGTSNRLGLDLTTAAQGYKTLAASARGTVMEGQAVQDLFEGVSGAAATLGLSAEQSQRVFIALSQVMSKGKVAAEEIRGQMGESLPGAFQIAAKAMNMTTAELDALLQKGGLAADDFMPRFAATLKKDFAAGAEEASKSGQASFARLENAYTQFKLALADTGIYESAVRSAQWMADKLTGIAKTIRELSGTESLKDRTAGVNQIIKNLESNIALYERIGQGDEENVQKMREKLNLYRQEMDTLNQRKDKVDADQKATQERNAAEKAAAKERAQIAASEIAWIDAKTKSANKETAAFYTKEKTVFEATQKWWSGEINAGALQAIVQSADEQMAAAGKKGTEVAKANAEAVKLINESKFKALEAEAALGGEDAKFDVQRLKANADYQKAIDELNVKLVGFKGTEKEALEASLKADEQRAKNAKLAKIDMDQWIASMTRAADLMTQLGEATFDPNLVMSGSLTKLQADRKKALNDYQGDADSIAKINQLYDIKEIQLRRTSYISQDDMSKKFLESRIQNEDDFSSYLADRLAVDYGLYKSALGQRQDLWAKYYDEIKKGIEAVENVVGTAIGNAIGDFTAGKFKGVQSYVNALLSDLKQAFGTFISDLARIAIRQYIVIPIVGQIVGTEGSFGSLTGTTGSNSSGFSLGSLIKGAGNAKDTYKALSSSGGWISDLDTWGLTNLGIGTLAGGYSEAALTAGSGAFSSAMAATELTGTQALAAADAAAVSAMTTAQGAATTAATISAGLGTVLAGVGAVAGIALLASEMTKTTTTHSWAQNPGTGQAVMLANGQVVPQSYGILRTTTSSMLGGDSTTHKTVYQAADTNITSQVNSNVATATAGLKTFAAQLGLTTDQLTKTQEGLYLPPMAISSDSETAQQEYRNLANLLTYQSLSSLGILERIQSLAQNGEAEIDTVTRLGNALASVETSALASGLSLEQFATGMDKLALADYASQLITAVGSVDALSAALKRLNTYGYSAQEQLENGLTISAVAAGRSIASIGDSSITMQNFWQRFRQAMESGMDPSKMAAWATASAKMEVWENAVASARQKEIPALQATAQALQEQASAAQAASTAWHAASTQLSKLKNSLLLDKTLTSLSPFERLNQAKSAFLSTAQSGDASKLADIDQTSKDYLQAALDYYGATADYYAIFDTVSGTVDSLAAYASAQASAADLQLAALNEQIAQNQAQIEAIQSGTSAVVNAIGSISGAISSALAAGNAAQAQASSSGTDWAAILGGGTTPTATTATPVGGDVSFDQAEWERQLLLYQLGIPAYAGGGTTPGGWFLAGDDPSVSGSGELMYSASPVKVFSNKKSKALLSRGQSQDTSGVEARLDAVGNVLVDILGVLQNGGADTEILAGIRNTLKKGQLVSAGQ